MSGNNGIVYTLVFFVLLSVVLLIVTVLGYSQGGEDAANIAKLTKELNEQKANFRAQTEALAVIKRKLGYEYDELGTSDETDPESVLGALNAELKNLNNPYKPGEDTVSAKLRSMQAALNASQLQLATRAKMVVSKDMNLASLDKQNQQIVDRHIGQVKKVEEDLRKKEQNHTEELDRKDVEIAKLTSEKKDIQDTLQQVEQEFRETVAAKDEYIGGLERSNARMMEEVAELADLSFETADGLIRWVDHNRNLVWLNLGESDDLRVRTTFSVYTKANHGVGRRDKEDIKAKIEVTSIKGAHLAEARILEQDIYRPIAKDDPIYSPAFTPGNAEFFSIVGLVDLDSDGVSDRGYLENMVRAAGAEFDNIVDDNGIQTGSGISIRTTFLVQGEIPGEVPTGDAEKDQAIKEMRRIAGDLQNQARANGVRMITLSDFRDYLGIGQPPRSWRPGDTVTQTKQNSRSAGSSGTKGKVTETFTRRRRFGPKKTESDSLYGK